MDERTAREYLATGLWRIAEKRKDWDRREDYLQGRHDLPYAPPGVNQEYESLRRMAPANWLGLAMGAPVQRLRAELFRTNRTADDDRALWNEVWQPNDLDARQRIPYLQGYVHGRGLMSVWPNARERRSPIIRPENGRRVHVQMDPEDPFTIKWVVKSFTEESAPSALTLPVSVSRERQVATVYDADTWARFERGGVGGTPDWVLTNGGAHPMGEPPFVTYDNNVDADGEPQSAIEPLMPAQDALNTIRFQTLLAMQFSAYRQRVVTAYDPVAKDETGAVIYRQNTDGSPVLDSDNRRVPVLNTFGRTAVDRMLVFPGAETKVFDLPESNLDNYIKVLSEFLTDLFAVGQIPPQYLLTRMANLSGDALAGAESTLASLVDDLQRWWGDSHKRLMRLAGRARGEQLVDVGSEIQWADAQARSFAQTIDAIVKLVSVKFPTEAAFEMIPGANPEKVKRWMGMRADELLAAADDPLLERISRDLSGGGDVSAVGG